MIRDESEIPDAWDIKTVDEIAKVNSGSGFSKEYQGHKNKPIPFYKVGDMNGFNHRMGVADNYVDESVLEELGAETYPENSVIFPKIGEAVHTNKKRILSEESAVDNNVMVVTPKENKINYKFLYYAFKNTNLGRFTRKTTVPSIRQSDIKDFRIPVPPLDEQERIVEAVEERLERVERLETSVANVGRLADEYQDSYKSYLSSGLDVQSSEVLKGIPEKDTLPERWNLSPLSEVAEINPRTSYDELDKYAYVPMDAVSAETQSIKRFDRRDSVYSSLARFEKGDILFARITPCFENGKIAIVPEMPEGYEFAVGSSEFAVINPKNIDTDYLHMYLTSPVVKEWGENRLTGSTGRERIQVTQIRNELNIPVPPMEKQKEIVNEIRETDFSRVSKAVSDLDNYFDEYRNSILSHAFKGDINY